MTLEYLKSSSVERRLRWVVMVASGTALLLLASGVALLDLQGLRRSLKEDLTTQADMVAESSTVAMSFDQPADAEDILRTLRADPQVISARLFDAAGKPFASYGAAGRNPSFPASPPRPGAAFVGGCLEVARPVDFNGRPLGTIWIRAGLAELRGRVLRHLGLAALLLPVAFAAASFLGHRLQRVVIQPILELCSCMERVTQHRDYSVRVRTGGPDEVGRLMDGFNAMLCQIEEQDAALKSERTRLACRVEERTAELQRANDDLRDANQRLQATTARAEQLAQTAESASRAKSDFLAIVSHELRTPMNGVIGFTDLLLDGRLDLEQREFAEIIRNSGQTLLGLINDILDFSKIEAGKFTLESIPFEIVPQVEGVVELFGHKADEKQIELVLRMDPRLPCVVLGDPARLRQILLNLLGNAIKFTERGHVLVEVGLPAAVVRHHPNLHWRLAEGPQVVLVVQDTGIGIPQEKQAGLFEPFKQADSSTTRRYGGTGLGLAISKRLIELHGGTLAFHSETGRGSTFGVALPLPVAPPDPVHPVLPEAPDLIPGDTRVLVVAHDLHATVLGEQLAAWNLPHAVARTGKEALQVLANAGQDPFAVVIIDSALPDLDPLALGRSIRGDAALDGTALILTVANAHRGESRRYEEAGIHACLVKPLVRPRLLRETLIRVLSHEAAGNAIRPPVETTAVRPVTAKALPAENESIGKPPPRILLAEDNAINQLYARRLLEGLGCRVDLAANGREAVTMTAQGAYDLILMDCQMPELNGYDATGEIRRREASGHRIPVIALTANALAGERERCLAAGMDDHLSKPFRREELTRLLDRWIGWRGTAVQR